MATAKVTDADRWRLKTTKISGLPANLLDKTLLELTAELSAESPTWFRPKALDCC